jgi:hypothetical protein
MFVITTSSCCPRTRSLVRHGLERVSPQHPWPSGGTWTSCGRHCPARPHRLTIRRIWHTCCSAHPPETPASGEPDDGGAQASSSGPLVLRLQRCRRCGELFDTRLNHKRACQFHGHALGDRGYYRMFMVPREEAESSLSWPEHGRETGSASPWVLQFRWSCCGATFPDSLGCRLDRHLGWDEEIISHEGLLNDAQMAAWKLRTQWG